MAQHVDHQHFAFRSLQNFAQRAFTPSCQKLKTYFMLQAWDVNQTRDQYDGDDDERDDDDDHG